MTAESQDTPRHPSPLTPHPSPLDDKPLKCLQGQFLDVLPIHAREFRSMPEPRAQALQCIGITGGDPLDPPVRQVPYPAAKTVVFCNPFAGGTKKHPLDASGHKKMYGSLHIMSLNDDSRLS